jgi:hypothetical protein
MKGGQKVTEKETTSSALTIVENLEPATVTQVMQRIVNFQGVIQKTLKEGHDYGVIPGTGNKPTLLKPGAEKILMLMGVTSEYQLIERVQDYEQGFFAFTVKCVLSRGGQVITEGLGHCNNREKKYRSERQDPYTLANTCLKMAKKRAQIDAVLTIASLSEVFTQDLEDLEFGNDNNGRNTRRTSGTKPTEKQLKMLFAKAKELEISEDVMRATMQTMFGKQLSKDLTRQEASELIDLLINIEKGEAELPLPSDDVERDIEEVIGQ